jgi:hypothetical protein
VSPGIRHADIEAMAADVDRSLEVRALASEWADRFASLSIEYAAEIHTNHCLVRVLVDVLARPGDITALRRGLQPELAAVLDQILGELPEAS